MSAFELAAGANLSNCAPLTSSQLRASQLYEQGRWIPWGNGVRID